MLLFIIFVSSLYSHGNSNDSRLGARSPMNSSLPENLPKEKRKRDDGGVGVGKRSKLKYRDIILNKSQLDKL